MRAKPVVADASVIIKWVIPEDYSEHAVKALKLLGEAELILEPVEPKLAFTALELSLELGVTPYGVAYLALARRLSAPFYTADEKLLSNRMIQDLRVALHIRDYPARA